MKKIIIFFISFIMIILSVGFIYKSSNAKKVPTNEYKLLRVSKGDGKGYIDVDGVVKANYTKKVFVDKKLKVDEVFIQKGDYVEKGQLLMTFDKTERNSIMRKLEREQLSLSKLKRNLLVEQELNKIGGSSTNYVKDLEEEVRKTELNIEEYMEDLEKTAEKIESPTSGTIISLTARENYLVDTDSPLLEIADLSDIKIVLEIAEYDIKDIKLGQSLIIKPEVFEKKEYFSGVITKISRISKKSAITSENVLEVEVKPNENIPYIVPGFKVSAIIYIDRDDENISIPKSAILEDKKRYYVFICDDFGTITQRFVEIDSTKGEKVFIKEGLEVGEEIIITPNYNLKSGDKIKKY
ncbi:efflux RND transporter periplasmic adaptor subunit [Fusobacterium sp.]|uniref:efflux RND transporter periplasmic adaptor subunit n=1 Tax=Fusobacterium sp. TaxID=68766 RepID=UPI00260630C1|nr:efflux RND transporter periplasmic adaptor subunit [Fusobacterium sp.]